MAYDDAKRAGRRTYTGMAVGRTHRWDYPDGRWVERKLAPDQWEVAFTSHKRRKGRAPEGSGAKVGSEHHWLIVAHQRVRKLDANTYATALEGTKFLVAFRQPGWQRWSSQFRGHKTQRERLANALRKVLAEVEGQAEPGGEGLLRLAPRLGRAAAARRPGGRGGGRPSVTRPARRRQGPARASRPAPRPSPTRSTHRTPQRGGRGKLRSRPARTGGGEGTPVRRVPPVQR